MIPSKIVIGEREIKFEVMLKREKVFRRAWGIDFAYKKAYILELDEWREYKTLRQFTGLFDRNGIEIYEGDIIKNNDQLWVVYYNDGAWRIAHNGVVKTPDHLLLLEPEHSEVIGNVFENSELLPPG